MAPMDQITHWIDGKPWVGDAERRGRVFNPATGAQSGEVDFATVNEVDDAVAAARRAFETWRTVSLAKRTNALFSLRSLLADHVADLARIVSAEHGKVQADAAGEVARGLEVIEFACGITQLLKGEFTEGASTGVNVHSLRQPLGVVAGITPFNFPAMVPLWMFPLAIACGNTFVLKPSEKDPSASQFLAELVAEAGFPNGVFNVVHGDKVAVDRILSHPRNCGRELRRLHAGRPPHLRDGRPERQACPGPRRGQESPRGASGCRHDRSGRSGRERRVRVGRGAVHGRLGPRGGGWMRRPAHRRHPTARSTGWPLGRAMIPNRRWAH